MEYLKSNIALLNCPFCGCAMSEKDGFALHGEHDEECFFYMSDNQNEYDFYGKESDLIKLHKAWNRRVYDQRKVHS